MSALAKKTTPEKFNENENSLGINYLMIRKSSLILRALNHKLRQQMIQIIAQEEKITVTDLYIQLRIEQSVASQHLAILRKVDIVTTQRSGKHIYYTINHPRVAVIKQFVKDLVG
jgi:DNA-binding transcriptional ArsR family regulator